MFPLLSPYNNLIYNCIIFKIGKKHSLKNKQNKNPKPNIFSEQRSYAKHTKRRKINYLIHLVDNKENKCSSTYRTNLQYLQI